MSRTIKEKLVGEYTERFRGLEALAVVDTTGIDVQGVMTLRGALRARGMGAMVVANRLCKRALSEVGLGEAGVLLRGPSALVWGGENLIDVAKTLVGQAKDLASLQVRGGYMDGRVLSKEDMDTLSKMPSREELIGMVVARAVGQAGRIVSLAGAPASGLLGQIRELQERGK